MKRGTLALASLLVCRIALHALFVPAWEGPDEIFHLGRVADFADRGPAEAFRGRELDGAIVADVRSRPCGPVVHPAFGCPLFGTTPASFNLLRPRLETGTAPPQRNPKNNQPPLFYALAGSLLRLLRPMAPDALGSPEPRLLAARVLCVLLAAGGIFVLLRLQACRASPLFAGSLLAVLALPGASESLARCSNDASVFAWCALVLLALERRTRTGLFAFLLLLGPLLKLTAIPVVVFAVAALWTAGRRQAAAGGAFASLLVFPLQLWRGWRWGGTYELNRPPRPWNEGASVTLAGLFRSAYTFVKTTFWLGGWSFFRAPGALVAAYGALLASGAALARVRRVRHRGAAHLAGLAVAAAGFVLFAYANRSFFGGWGGVGGWYVWSWFPWLAMAAYDTTSLGPRSARFLAAALGAFVLAANAAYYLAAYRLYR